MMRPAHTLVVFACWGLLATSCDGPSATAGAMPTAVEGSSPASPSGNRAALSPSATSSALPLPADPAVSLEDDLAGLISPAKPLTPMEAIKDLDRQVEGYHLGQNITPEQLRENENLKRRIIRGTFDIEELCRLSLAKHWEAINADEQGHFVELMTRLLEKKAIFSKEQLRGDNKYYQIRYLSEKTESADKSKAVVTTKMVVPKKRLDLDLTYKLVRRDAAWKIYDVIVDDASLLTNYRFQFDRIIQKGGFGDLIRRMETKLAQMGTD